MMKKLEDVLSIIMKLGGVQLSENIELSNCLDRILAKDIVSDINMPPFDKSAVDGFACKSTDIKKELEIIETIPAGKVPEKKVETGQCARIMTGAPIPEGTDCVIMKEDTETFGKRMKILKSPDKSNICYLGEDVKKGDKVLVKGTLLAPQHLSILATVGCINPLVFKKPKVSVIVSGNEIVEPGLTPEPSKIRNSNGTQLLNQLIKAGCEPYYIGIIDDDVKLLRNAISKAYLQSNILIITGGASKGDFDLIPATLNKTGFKTYFTEVAIQPGKPFSFSTKENLFCFGLSGNPVSSYIQFEVIVKPFLYRMAGRSKIIFPLKVPIGEYISRKKTEREYYFPVKFSEEFKAIPVEFHGSAHIMSLTEADGIAQIPVGIKEIKEGELVNVRPI